MKVLVDTNRLLVLKQGDTVDTQDGERARITRIDLENENVYVKFDRRRFQTVTAGFIGAEFRNVESSMEQAMRKEASNDDGK